MNFGELIYLNKKILKNYYENCKFIIEEIG